MLLNGLGTLLKAEMPKHDRVVDLFCGAASVSWFAAVEGDRPVLSVDLQEYGTTLAGAVTVRTKPADPETLIKTWIDQIKSSVPKHPLWKAALAIDQGGFNIATWCKRAREFCSALTPRDGAGIVLHSYGGHYFSPTQGILFDRLLNSLPAGSAGRICRAAAVIAASQCVASPGHTAQPFQPTRTAGPFLREAWLRDPLMYAERAIRQICPMHAKAKGQTEVGDALKVAGKLNKTDLVFVDPPYSAVHYSRFYHVLETVARGNCSAVTGTGRYPPPEERPPSAFSRKGESQSALINLLETLAGVGCTVAFTFPQTKCSNGLSGLQIAEIAKTWFDVQNMSIQSRFSTLGGNNDNRKARSHSRELILLMRPSKKSVVNK